MKIVITGGAGFFGLHCAKYFVSKKSLVTLVDIAPFEKNEYPQKNTKFVKGDVRDSKIMNQVTKGCDVVVHAAAALPLWKEGLIYDININGTKNVLECCVKNKVKQLIFISSTAVYGVPKVHPIYETDKRVGVGPYGTSKIKAEEICEQYRKKGLIITIIRPKTFIGTHRLGVFEILFDWVKDGKHIPVIGNGLNRYQLLDVDDLVTAIYRLTILKDKKKANDVFNIGAAKYKTVKDDLYSLFRYAKSGSDILTTPAGPIKACLWIFEKLKLSPLYQWVYDTADKDSFVAIDRLVKTLKWKPEFSNSQTLIKSYQWYLDNYSKIKSRPEGVTHRTGWKQGILGLFKKFL